MARPVSQPSARRLDVEGKAARVKYFGVGGLTVATRVTGSVNAGLYFTHGDHQGSLQVLTTAAGTAVQRLTYQPFGETTSTGSVDFTSRRYTGQIADPETGLYFYNARYYNPVLGRFLAPDTLVPTPGNPQSLNRYSYVENNPVRWTDPSGHFIPGLIGIFVGVLAGALAYEGLLWLGVGAAGALVGAGMVGGAVAGGVSAAIAGGDMAFSIMLGAAFGGIAAYTGPPLFAFYTASLGRFGAAMATGATLGAAFGAAGTAIRGGNILQGTLSGAVSGAVTAAVAYGVTYLQGQSPALASSGETGEPYPPGAEACSVNTIGGYSRTYLDEQFRKFYGLDVSDVAIDLDSDYVGTENAARVRDENGFAVREGFCNDSRSVQLKLYGHEMKHIMDLRLGGARDYSSYGVRGTSGYFTNPFEISAESIGADFSSRILGYKVPMNPVFSP